MNVAGPKEFDGKSFRFAGYMSKQCWQYHLMDMAGQFLGLTSVPLYDTLGEEAIQWILSQTEMDVTFCENEAVMPLLTANENSGKFLKTIICSDSDETLKPACSAHSVNL